ncbi:MAG: hypothetical protein V3V99_12805 [candidate division Zixibacteria bacterium]
MRHLYLNLIIFAIAAFLISGCDDDPVSSKKMGLVLTSQHNFPKEVGMYWEYAVHDSLTGETDTVEVSIVDTLTVEDTLLTMKWNVNYSDGVIRRYYTFRGDTLMISNDSLMMESGEWFVFPFELNSMWTGPNIYDDTSRVTEIGTISVPAGTFTSATKIDRIWWRDFEGGGNYSTTWIADSVGMVYRHHLSQYSDGAQLHTRVNETWELLNFNLTTFYIEQFPNDIAFFWKYESYDSINNIYDTVFVLVTDTITVSTVSGDILGKVWVYDYGDRQDTEYVAVVDNRIEVYPLPRITIPELNPLRDYYYEFPLTVGRYWGILFFFPIPDVFEKVPVRYRQGGEFTAFKHFYSQQGLSYFKGVESLLVPNIGVMSRTVREYNLGPMTKVTYELIDYGYLED